MNTYLIFVLAIIVGNYTLDFVVDVLNARATKSVLPDEFKGYYDETKYKKSQEYLKENTYFKLVQNSVMTILILFLILSGAFDVLDQFARGLVSGQILCGLIFVGIIFFGLQIVEIPFSWYHTFVIEEKYGFNKTTIKTFITDLLKSWVLGVIIGGVIFSVIIWFFLKAGTFAWLWCWAAVTVFGIFLEFIYPVAIMPMFNKFTPLEDGELKTEIQDYARKRKFALAGIFTMDGSRRSSKSNAFFTGFGKFRRIALFDTLIANHTIEELVSVLAHEVGHYKKKHIVQRVFISILTNGMMFFILSLFIDNKDLFAAFKMQEVSIYAGLLFFGFIYAPISKILSIAMTRLSQKHEYEADYYAITTYDKPQGFILALKKLSVDNLSNLTPHPLKVFLEYSHPPVLKRIERIRQIGQ